MSGLWGLLFRVRRIGDGSGAGARRTHTLYTGTSILMCTGTGHPCRRGRRERRAAAERAAERAAAERAAERGAAEGAATERAAERAEVERAEERRFVDFLSYYYGRV